MVKVTVTQENGMNTTFEYENCDIYQQRGIEYKKDAAGEIIDLDPNGQEQCCIKLWSGCPTYESFQESNLKID